MGLSDKSVVRIITKANVFSEFQGSKSVKPVVADSVEQGTSAGDDALDSSEDNGRSTFPVITFPPPFSQPPPLPPLPSLPSLQLPLPLSLPQLQMPPHFPALSRPPRAPGPAPSSVGNGLAPIQPEDLKSVWLETFLLGFSVDPKVIKALETEEVTVKVLVDEGTEEGVYKLLRMVAEATGVKITVGQQARVWHAVRQWRDNKRKAQELEGAYRFFSWNSSTHFTGGYSFQDIYVYFSLVVYLF
jgi:hypothetical protein